MTAVVVVQWFKSDFCCGVGSIVTFVVALQLFISNCICDVVAVFQ